MKLLIDGDILLYQISHRCQRTSYELHFGKDRILSFGNASSQDVHTWIALMGKDAPVGTLIEHFTLIKSVEEVEKEVDYSLELLNSKIKGGNAERQIILADLDQPCFRYKIAITHPYKKGRDKVKPIAYAIIRKHLIDRGATTPSCFDGMSGTETDDVLGMLCRNSPESTIIATRDKDLDMIPGYHINLHTYQKYVASDRDSLYLSDNHKKLSGRGLIWFYAQMLMGDTADNIHGLKGWGPVRTFDFLQSFFSSTDEQAIAQAVHAEYEGEFKVKATSRFLENSDLLWIWRKPRDCKSDHLKMLLKIKEE